MRNVNAAAWTIMVIAILMIGFIAIFWSRARRR
jgi:hypothetical protein